MAVSGDVLITVDPTQAHQSIIGFGAALTDASVDVLEHDLTPPARAALLHELFADEGLGAIRLTIGASDFSTSHYTYDDIPSGQEDSALSAFSLKAAEGGLIPLWKEIHGVRPDLWTMASPWSAPAWMKSNDSLIGGALRQDRLAPFAAYLVRYLAEMRIRGVPIDALTVQNEPGFSTPNYPGMLAPPHVRASLIGEHLGPALKAAGLATVILDYDHNWDTPDSPLTVLADEKASSFTDGVAWHCYAGDPSAEALVSARRPDKNAYLTECSGGGWSSDWKASFTYFAGVVMIDSLRAGSRSILLWNLVLDEKHGPHHGGCDDCRGVVTVDSRTGEVSRNQEYYALGHLSRFVKRGAVRIDAASGDDGVKTIAIKNPNGQIVLMALNTTANVRNITVLGAAGQFNYSMPAGAAATFVWAPGPK